MCGQRYPFTLTTELYTTNLMERRRLWYGDGHRERAVDDYFVVMVESNTDRISGVRDHESRDHIVVSSKRHHRYVDVSSTAGRPGGGSERWSTSDQWESCKVLALLSSSLVLFARHC